MTNQITKIIDINDIVTKIRTNKKMEWFIETNTKRVIVSPLIMGHDADEITHDGDVIPEEKEVFSCYVEDQLLYAILVYEENDIVAIQFEFKNNRPIRHILDLKDDEERAIRFQFMVWDRDTNNEQPQEDVIERGV